MSASILVSLLSLIVSCIYDVAAQPSLSGFTQWRTGHDDATIQFLPSEGNDPLVSRWGDVLAIAKFKVKGYGEMSFPIDSQTPAGEEARKVDLSRSSFVRITYKATSNVILQLRQTGVHGGVHNHVTLPATRKFVTRTLYFYEFQGGKAPLDLADVAKFNFAFLGRKDQTGYTAKLVVKAVEIDHFNP